MKTRIAGWLSMLSYVGLILYMMAWIITLGDVPREQISIGLIIAVTPLLLPLRGVLAARDKAMIWGTLVVLLYIVHGGVIAWSEPGYRWFGLLEVALALTYLVSASFFVRWRAEATQQG
jgi:uncharacterized membrane protein